MKRIAKALALLAGAAIGSLVALGVERIVYDTSILAEGTPTWGARHALKSALALVSAALFVAAIRALPRVDRGAPGWTEWGWIGWSADESRPVLRLALQEIVAWGAYALFLALALLFPWKPVLFHKLSREGGAAESLSALLCFVASGVLLVALIRLLRGRAGVLPALAAAGLAAVMFLIGMEEVSWFQRVLSVETPDAFRANLQGEMNLHNFATDPIENLYYGAAFLFAVALPFALDRIPGSILPNRLVRFVPGQPVLVVGALAAPFNYDMWNGYFTQLCLYATVLILATVLWPHRRSLVLASVPLAIVAVQALFLALGDRFVRDWDVTEYKELFIPLAFAIYAIEVLTRTVRSSEGPGGDGSLGSPTG